MNRLSVMVVVVCLIFLSSLVLIPNAFSQVANTNVKVLSYSWYLNPSGDFIVVGEVQNTGNHVLQTVSLNAAVYSASGSQLASASTMAYVSYLLPQQKAPFYIDFGNPGTGTSLTSSVSTVDFTVSNATTTNNQEYGGLSLHTAFNSTLNGVYAVMGLITNSGNQTANDVRVVGTYYNSAGSVVAVGFVILDNPLVPDNSTTFILSEFDATTSMVAQISDYSLLVQTATLQNTQSNSYSSGSPTPSTSSLGSSVLIYVVVGVAVIVVVAVALVFLRKRRNLPLPPPPPPEEQE